FSDADKVSRRRSGTEVRTSQWMRQSGCCCCKASIVPPQPISTSSQWAPMNSTSRRRPRWGAMLNGNTAASSLPDHPGAVAPRFHAVEGDLVLEGVHRAPEAVVAVDAEELLLDQALEGALDELVALL